MFSVDIPFPFAIAFGISVTESWPLPSMNRMAVKPRMNKVCIY